MLDRDEQDRWVAVRVALLYTDRRGRLAPNRALVDRAVRVALFLDVVLRHGIDIGGADVHVDTCPVGFAPADALSTWIDTHASSPLAAAFESAPVTAEDVVRAASPATGAHPRRAPRLDPAAATLERDRLGYAADAGTVDGPVTAVTLALAEVLGFVAVDEIDSVYARCGAAGPIVADCCRWVRDLMDKLAAVSTLPTVTG